MRSWCNQEDLDEDYTRPVYETSVADGVNYDAENKIKSTFKVKFQWWDETTYPTRNGVTTCYREVHVEEHEVIEGVCEDKENLRNAIDDYFKEQAIIRIKL